MIMTFDNEPNKIGHKINGVTIEDFSNLEKRIKSQRIQLFILAVPESVAPTIARRLAKLNVKAILSFSPCQIAMPNDIKVTCVDLSIKMARLIYYSSRKAFSEIESFDRKGMKEVINQSFIFQRGTFVNDRDGSGTNPSIEKFFLSLFYPLHHLACSDFKFSTAGTHRYIDQFHAFSYFA